MLYNKLLLLRFCKNLTSFYDLKTVMRMLLLDFDQDISYFIQQYSFLTHDN